MHETIFVTTLFGIYLALWKIKERTLIRTTGVNPKVMAQSSSEVQKFMDKFGKILTGYVVLIIIAHSIGIHIGLLFSRVSSVNTFLFDSAGLLTGLTGLSLCLYAQIKMGNSWRVGIDEKKETELVTTGLFRVIRNPTYLGFFMLNAGIWLIWPTWAVFLLNLLFSLFLEIQVRCEEDFLLTRHGEKYREYKRGTKRYVPFIY